MSDECGWPQGALLGLVEVKRIIMPDDGLPKRFTKQDEFLCGSVEGVCLWEIGHRWAFATPVPCNGQLNLWRPPVDLHAKLNRRLAAAGTAVRISVS
jgi:hypothetical protein